MRMASPKPAHTITASCFLSRPSGFVMALPSLNSTEPRLLRNSMSAHDLLVQSEIGDEVCHPAESPLLIVNRDFVTLLHQEGRRAEARRPGSNDSDLLSIPRRPLEFRHAGIICLFDNGGLDGGDIDRRVEQPARARLHAESIGAHDAAHTAERIRPHDQRRRPAVIGVLTDARSHDEIGWRAICRAGFHARLLLAVLASIQFHPELGVGQTSVTLFHSATAGKYL